MGDKLTQYKQHKRVRRCGIQIEIDGMGGQCRVCVCVLVSMFDPSSEQSGVIEENDHN